MLGRIPADRLYRTGLNILKLYPLPNIASVPAGQPTTTSDPARRQSHHVAAAGDPPRLPAVVEAARHRQVLGLAPARTTIVPGLDSRLQRHADEPIPFITTVVGRRSTTRSTRRRSSKAPTGSVRNAGRLRLATATARTSAPPVPDRTRSRTGQTASAASRSLFPDASVIDPRYYAYEVLNAVNPPIWDGTRMLLPPAFPWGSRRRHRASPNQRRIPGSLNINRDAGRLGQPDQGRRAGTRSRPASTTTTASRRRTSGGAAFQGTSNFGNDSEQPARHRLRLRQRGARRLHARTRRRRSSSKAASSTTTPKFYVQDNWKVNNRLTLDYGVRLHAPAAAVRPVPADVELLPGPVDRRRGAAALRRRLRNGAIPARAPTARRWIRAPGQILGPNATLGASARSIPSTGNADQRHRSRPATASRRRPTRGRRWCSARASAWPTT